MEQISLKILHVLDRSIPNLSGYSIRSKYIVENQNKLGFCPIVLTSPRFHTGKKTEILNNIEYIRTTLKKHNPVFTLPFIKEFYEIILVLRKILHISRKHDFDIIHAHSPSLWGIAAMLAAQRLKKPFCYEVRAFWEDAAVDLGRFKEQFLFYRISQHIENIVFKKADAIICICNGLKKEIISRINKKNIFLVPNGVDTKIFRPLPQSNELSKKYDLEGKTTIGFIGSFFTFEGLDLLIRAIPKILRNRGNIAFLFVGDGVERENLTNLVKSMRLPSDRIIFTGRVPHEKILNYYSLLDILVYPRTSKRITELVTPLKPLEAMSMGKVVLASNVGGLQELIEDNVNGVIFEKDNIDDLASKLIMLLDRKDLRQKIGQKAIESMRIDRDWSRIIHKYKRIYSTIIR